MVDSVKNLAHAIVAVQLRLAAAKKTSSVKSSATASSDVEAESSAARVESGNAATLPAQLAALSGDPEEQRKRALRVVVHAVLLDEFGAEVSSDPALDNLVDRVAAALESSESGAALVSAVLAELRS